MTALVDGAREGSAAPQGGPPPMDIRVSGHQIETGEALQEHVVDRPERDQREILRPRDLPRRSPSARPARQPSPATSCARQPGAGAQEARPGAGRAPSRSTGAADKIEKQLRRYKRRLKDRHEQAEPRRRSTRRRQRPTPCSTPATDEDARRCARRSSPKRASTFPKRSVSDAVMMLDLRHTNALLFVNSWHRHAQYGLSPRRRVDRLGRAFLRPL